MASDNQGTAEPLPSGSGHGIGSLLRETRVRLGQDVAAVATQLRIRQVYLQAIEDGRFQDLPGAAYAVGFVRGYADYLGLDSEEIVRRFKLELGGEFGGRRELVFPQAVSEGSIPSGALLFLALLLAGVAYGAWYWYQSSDTELMEAVPALPDRLAALIHRPVGGSNADIVPVTQDVAKTPAPIEPVAPQAAHEDMVPPYEGDNAPVPAAAAQAPVKAPVEPARVEQTKLSDAKSVKDLKRLDVKPTKSADDASAAPAAGKPESDEEAPVPMPEDDVPPKPAMDVPPPLKAQTDLAKAAAAKPVEDSQPSRVVLKAEEDCWVEIREASGQVVYSRLLHKGETYAVPARSGLSLTAGNAAALSMTVDGRNVSALGKTKSVRRDVSLDPDRLAKSPSTPPALPANVTAPNDE